MKGAARQLVYFIEIWARGGSMTTAGGGHRKRKTVERGLEDLHGARPSIFIQTGNRQRAGNAVLERAGNAVRAWSLDFVV